KSNHQLSPIIGPYPPAREIAGGALGEGAVARLAIVDLLECPIDLEVELPEVGELGVTAEAGDGVQERAVPSAQQADARPNAALEQPAVRLGMAKRDLRMHTVDIGSVEKASVIQVEFGAPTGILNVGEPVLAAVLADLCLEPPPGVAGPNDKAIG